ncbi:MULTISPECIES: hypothetical protein [unclassified Leptospira]|uniref:hypothetical protein n=1 Tax=unclassified Leptospira TaxID=2633828 RepID=UPI0002BD35C3|nr:MULTISPECIES: hypothetical protein [unclassified Leptospira]EMJ98366.1 putative membrane protein [Leptospira sp. B5-022]MCR1795594.1 hypothetical protein [Leptospira sp. id769339]
MNKETIILIFKNKYFQFSVLCYLLIQILIVPGKYFSIDAENNDISGSFNSLVVVLAICFIILGLKAILELTYIPNIIEVSFIGMIGRLFVYTLVNWFSFIIYCYILFIITGSQTDFDKIEQSAANSIILIVGIALYFVIYLAGAATIVGLRSMGNYFSNLKIIFLNKESYIYFSIFLIIPTLIGVLGMFERPFVRVLEDLLLSATIFVTYINFIFLVKHWQRIKLLA